MVMSKDRVEFTLKAYYFQPGIGPNRREDLGNVLLNESLGLLSDEIERIRNVVFRFGEVRLIARPSQFARFLIIREQLGFQNQFKELKAKLVSPTFPVITNEPIDISRAPAAGAKCKPWEA